MEPFFLNSQEMNVPLIGIKRKPTKKSMLAITQNKTKLFFEIKFSFDKLNKVKSL